MNGVLWKTVLKAMEKNAEYGGQPEIVAPVHIIEKPITVHYEDSATCIMCVQYRGGIQYRGGCSVPWGDIMSTVGGYLEYCGGCSVPWGIS